MLAVTIKLHLQKCIKKYPEIVEFLNKNIYEDDVIGSQSSVEQSLSTASLWTFLKKLVCNSIINILIVKPLKNYEKIMMQFSVIIWMHLKQKTFLTKFLKQHGSSR